LQNAASPPTAERQSPNKTRRSLIASIDGESLLEDIPLLPKSFQIARVKRNCGGLGVRRLRIDTCHEFKVEFIYIETTENRLPVLRDGAGYLVAHT
jgi:hypothetical protein